MSRLKSLVIPKSIFGSWTVESSAGVDAYYNQLVNVICLCGKKSRVRLTVIKSGKSTHCGCQTPLPPTNLKHGQSGTVEYSAWQHMKSRCTKSSDPEWENYGGRGITVCPEWMESFEKFFDYIGFRPSSKYSIDRIDNNNGYFPGNVRWSTNSEQTRNYRRNNWITANGETMLLSEWAKRLGTKSQTIIGRLNRGWSKEDAVTVKINQQHGGHRVKVLCDI